jgi:hypothetical protein
MRVARLVRRTGLAVALAGGMALAGLATPAFAVPPGNHGTIKIDREDFDDHSNNEPHVGCTFQVDFYGFDKGEDLFTDVTFRAQPPTGKGVLLEDRVFIGEDNNSAGRSGAGLDASATYTLDFSGFDPAQQGFYVKLTINADGSQGADTKHKVFWVEECERPSPTPTEAPTEEPTDNPTDEPTDEPTDDETKELEPVRTAVPEGTDGSGGGSGAGASLASAATGDIGQLGPSFSGVTNPPTSDKPQSKLWYTDGIWWADMFHAASRTWRIHRLDRATGQWVDTSIANDGRVNTLADTLWDGTHLYIATHVVTASTEANPKPSLANSPSRLYRYSYSAATKTFTPDAGFPKVISTQSSESLTIDKDSTGTLWATWTQVSGNSTNGFTNTVYVNATTSNDDSWGTPFAMPAGDNPAPDDISAVVAYGGNKVGVMWSNQIDETVYWAVHVDGTATSDWRVAPALRGTKQADDHMNLKALQADQAGRVFAAVKTSADEAPGATSSDPQVLLLVFKPGTAAWTSTVVGTLADCHTRPQLVLDEEHSVVHVVATAPSTSGCPAPGTAGTIYDKSAPMDDPVFLAGRGTPIIRDAASANTNNPTSTKQNVTGASGLVVLASNTSTARYWHADLALGASADTTAPSTPGSLSATAASSTRVDLTWTASSDAVGVMGYRVYRNGSTAPLASVGSGILTYSDTTVAGGTSYTYQVSAVDAAGNESGRATASVTTPTSVSQTLTFTPTDDATIDASAPTLNAGTSNRVGIDGSPVNTALFKFAVTGTAGCTVTSARLRLTVGSTNKDQSAYGGDVYGVADTGWSESTVTWATRPAADTTKVGSISSSVALNGTYTVDVTSLVKGDGLVSMQVSSANSDGARYWSKDGSTATQVPQLQVTCG